MFRDSISKFFKIDSLINNLTGYVETRIELLKLEVREEMAKGLARVLFYLLLAFVFAVVVVFISVAVALQLSLTLGGFAGFAIVAAFYLLAGLILFFTKNGLINNLERKISDQLKKKNNE